mmetsp:Transcript_131545/g.311884  ORF Transcript_131545/g.311884 Transcript_131545/m.311884 type:complete len:252 (+) Transcript_131545:799-1554(+)
MICQHIFVLHHCLLYVLTVYAQLLFHCHGHEKFSSGLTCLVAEASTRLLIQRQEFRENLLHLYHHELMDLHDLLNANTPGFGEVAFGLRVKEQLGLGRDLLVLLVLCEKLLEGLLTEVELLQGIYRQLHFLDSAESLSDGEGLLLFLLALLLLLRLFRYASGQLTDFSLHNALHSDGFVQQLEDVLPRLHSSTWLFPDLAAACASAAGCRRRLFCIALRRSVLCGLDQAECGHRVRDQAGSHRAIPLQLLR